MDQSSLDRASHRFVIVQVVALVFLQRLAIHVGDADVQLILPIMLVSICVFAIARPLCIGRGRLILFAAFAGAAIVAQIMGGVTFSAPGLALLLVMYPVMCLFLPVSGQGYLRCINAFQLAIILIGAITIALQVIQYTIGPQYWPNMDAVLPASIIIRGFNYLQPVAYGSQYFKPNAFFMIEVSEISQLAVLAIAVEIALFRRLAVMAFLAVVTLATFAGTGLLMLVFLAVPALFVLPLRTGLPVVIGTAIIGLVTFSTGWQETILHRVGEFTEEGTSGYYRFNVPIQVFVETAAKPDFLLHGNGAGSTLKGTVFLLLPFAKLIFEYGLLTTVLFYLFLGTSIFLGAPSRYIGYAALLQYTIGGSNLAMPMSVATLLILGTFLRPDPLEVRIALAALPRGAIWDRLVRPAG